MERTSWKTRCRWEDNITTDLREIGWEGVVWILVAQVGDQWHGLVNVVMNIEVPRKMGCFLTTWRL